MPRMPGVANLEKVFNQRTLLVGFERDVEFDHHPSGCVSQTLPVGWNVIQSVHDPHLIPMCGGYREVGEY